MDKYREITEARKILNLSERATLQEIKSNYRALLDQWHPDKCTKDKIKCAQITKQIISAYKIIISYCDDYKYSFSRQEVDRYLSAEEWWYKHFGEDD